MYAVGHLALGYLSGRTASKILDVNVNISLIFLISVIPDIDLLIPGLRHRGPMHSVILYCFLFLPVFPIFRKRAIPYFVALIQHVLIGDYLVGHSQLLWPITNIRYGLGMEITSLTNILIELTLFLASTAILFKTRDAMSLLQQHSSNIVLTIPVLTVLLPTLLSFPTYVSTELVIPHIFYMALFTLSIFVDLKAILPKT